MRRAKGNTLLYQNPVRSTLYSRVREKSFQAEFKGLK